MNAEHSEKQRLEEQCTSTQSRLDKVKAELETMRKDAESAEELAEKVSNGVHAVGKEHEQDEELPHVLGFHDVAEGQEKH